MLQGIAWGRHPSWAFPSRSHSHSRPEGQKIILLSSSTNHRSPISPFSQSCLRYKTVVKCSLVSGETKLMYILLVKTRIIQCWLGLCFKMNPKRSGWLSFPLSYTAHYDLTLDNAIINQKNRFCLGTIAGTELRQNKLLFTKRIPRDFWN